MLKYAMLASAMIVAAPVAAQIVPQTGVTAPIAQAQSAVPGVAGSVTGSAGVGVQADPATGASAGVTADAGATTTAAQPSQIAQVVDQEFASYDKDGDGALDKTEFAAWMDKLKASTPDAKPMPAAKQTAWNNAAFKQADADKSAKVDKAELTGFLSGSAKAG